MMTIETIHQKEENLFQEWGKQFELNGHTGFCKDGLIFNGELHNELKNRKSSNQEENWMNAKRRILFFMKEPNDNADQDYREWGLYQQTSSTFFRFIYSWLNGLSTVTAKSPIPPITTELDLSLPLCIVNAKKASGGSSASYSEIWAHEDQYRNLLRQQFDIYAPNIIVCGGSWNMAKIVKRIYNDIEFTLMENSDWIWYSIEKQMILIDSYHPCAFKSNDAKYNKLIEHFQKFLELKVFDL
ncbi:MAG TPA: hypothetical protein VGK10_04015 [Prolixibacteraceae bacterium]